MTITSNDYSKPTTDVRKNRDFAINIDVDKVSTAFPLLVEAYHDTDALRSVNDIPYFYTVSTLHRSIGSWEGEGCGASPFIVYLLGLVPL